MHSHAIRSIEQRTETDMHKQNPNPKNRHTTLYTPLDDTRRGGEDDLFHAKGNIIVSHRRPETKP